MQSSKVRKFFHLASGSPEISELIEVPLNQFKLVEGKVEETIPGTLPDEIAILRLDTDWYESTKHEMVHLFPRLVSKGVLIVDDYYTWSGSKKAVDEYLAAANVPIFHPIERQFIGIKP